MWRFNIAVFALLGAAFYNLSGGADYAPRQESLQASGWTVLRTPEVAQTALAPADSGQVVSRASVSLEALPAAAPQRAATLPVLTLAAAGSEATPQNAVQSAPAPEVVLPGLTEMIAAAAGARTLSLQDSTVDTAATAEDAAEDIRRIRPARVNMRNGPGTNYGVVDKLAQGTEVRVLDSNGDWVKMRVTDSGRIGWVAANLLVAVN